ncbi:MAG: hypothetical protein HY579_09405 [Nitrospinae bacterium]|nr:hypothetical protein [Nitrospinota bacterium]
MRPVPVLFGAAVLAFLLGCETPGAGKGAPGGAALTETPAPETAPAGDVSAPAIPRARYKKTVAVSRFDVSAGKAALGNGMADMLTDSLIRSGNFVVLERQTLEDVVGEQDLAASGRAAASKAAQTGRLVPAQVLVKGTVTEFEEQSAGSASGVEIGGIKLGSKSSTAHVAVILRIIDTASGQVLDSARVEGKAEGSGLQFGVSRGGVDFGTEGFAKTPLGKAAQIAIDNAVVNIARKLSELPFGGKIIKVGGGVIYTDIGERNGVAVGDVFQVFAPGEELTDPVTGESLGSEKTKVGAIRITDVQEKFSKAVPDRGELFEKGFVLAE